MRVSPKAPLNLWWCADGWNRTSVPGCEGPWAFPIKLHRQRVGGSKRADLSPDALGVFYQMPRACALERVTGIKPA